MGILLKLIALGLQITSMMLKTKGKDELAYGFLNIAMLCWIISTF